MGLRTPYALFVAALALFTLLASTTTASADLTVGSIGSGAGQYKDPRGVAVDTSNGRVYVADAENRRVDVFDSSGAFLSAFGWNVNASAPEEKLQSCTTASGCQKGTSGAGAGQFAGFGGFRGTIAVDSASHVVYVIDSENNRIQKFDSLGNFLWMIGKGVNSGTSGKPDICTNAGPPTNVCGKGSESSLTPAPTPGQFKSIRGIAVGPGGTVYVGDEEGTGPCPFVSGPATKKRVQVFTPSGEFSKAFEPTNVPCGQMQGIAVHSTGEFYMTQEGLKGSVSKYDATGNPDSSWNENGIYFGLNISALALDPAGNLFLGGNNNTSGEIDQLDPAGIQLRTFYGSDPLASFPNGLAFFQTGTGDIFVSQRNGTVVHIPIPDGAVPYPGSCNVSGVTNSRATFKCRVNPEGKASTFHYEYVDEATYQEDLPNGFEDAQSSAEEPVPGPIDFELHNVEQKLPAESLAPETEYRFRIVVTNADGANAVEGLSFETSGAGEVLDTWASEVGSDSARGHAELNPLELATTGRFEYVDEASFESEGGFASPKTRITTGQIDFGNGEKAVRGSTLLTGLQPGTTYHYRLRGESTFGQFFGEEEMLRTFSLPVSQTACPNQVFRVGPSAALPDCRAYELVTPLDKNNGDVLTRINITGYPTSLNQSSLDGSGFTYSSYRAFANPQAAPYTNQYLAFRDPASGWQSESIVPPRGPQYRNSELENEYKAFTADLSQAWMLQEGEPTLAPCAPQGFMGLYRRESATGTFAALSCAQPSLAANLFVPELQGFSADGSVAVFRINDELTVSDGPPPSGAGNFQLYVSSGAEQLRMASVLPDGSVSEADSSAGSAQNDGPANENRFQVVEGTLSEDGTRVFWSTGDKGSGPLYLRVNATSGQSLSGACDEAGKACTISVSGGDPALFQVATSHGTKALYKVTAGPRAGDLYEFDVASESALLLHKDVMESILGASEDLSRVYLASTAASAEEQTEGAEVGKANVYLVEGETSRFVGKLASEGQTSDVINGYGTPIKTEPIFHTARVSPDGQSLVFMSNSPALAEGAAGYDNTELKSPARCGEENETGEDGVCVAEVYLYDAEADGGAGKLRCVSCNPSGARPTGREIAFGANGNPGPVGAATIPPYATQFYQPRYLSDGGDRVFFNSFEALVLRDTNGKADVYQWLALGSGGCAGGSAAYVPSSEGCLSLISSGQSPHDSEFLDANPTGSDVFFTTAEGLLPQDYGLVDAYDARVNGGFPLPPSPPPACEGDACQSPVVPPNDPTPASSSFEGAGDPVKKARRSSRCPAGKRKVRKAGKSRCVKAQKAKSKQRNRKHSDKGRAGR